MILGIVALHNGMGYLLGYWASRIFHLAEIDCRAVSIEVGMQNSGLGVALAATHFAASPLQLCQAPFSVCGIIFQGQL